MKGCYVSKEVAAEYASDYLLNFEPDSPWTMIIRPEKFGDCCVCIATNTEWEEVGENISNYSVPLSSILTETTPGG